LIIELDKLDEKFMNVLCYPKKDKKEFQKRILELKRLGVKALEFSGEKEIDGIPVLGRGCVGIVVLAIMHDNRKVAIKIRRVDADRKTLKHEAEMLKLANSVNVGPKLIAATNNFIVMEFIKGKHLPEWIRKADEKEIRKALRKILEDCRKLDKIKLSHGELSRAPKHIMVSNGKPIIVDFETASIKRKKLNVTAVCQYLFIRREIANTIKEKIGEINTEKLVKALKAYKKNPTEENFDAIIKTCNLK